MKEPENTSDHTGCENDADKTGTDASSDFTKKENISK